MAVVANTLGYMKARIGREIARPGLTSQIADAITDAISQYAKERFRFSESIPSDSAGMTFNTVAGRYIYTSADNANIGSAYGIDTVYAQIGTASLIALDRQQPDDIVLYNLPNQQIMGQPTDYAYQGNQLLIAPTPDRAYAITLDVFRNVAAPADDNEVGNKWMTDGEMLIRCRAKFEIATHVTRNPAMAQAMSPEPPERNGGVVGATWRAYRSLKGEANRIATVGKIRAMQF